MTVSEYLTPHLRELSRGLRAALPRLKDDGDEEAVHDLRVVIRRLRSLLRPARVVYGKFHTDAVRDALKGVADATGDLRDEEVLDETVADLALPPAVKDEVTGWLARRQRKEHAHRRALLRLVEQGAVERALEMLDALLALPVNPKKDRPAEAFAREVVAKAEKGVRHGPEVPLDDVAGLHALRIAYKRLRYAVEGLEGVLPKDVVALAPVAARFQKRLGELHDVDVAVQTFRRARGVSLQMRMALLEALDDARWKNVSKYLAEQATKSDAIAKVEPVLDASAARTR